MQQPSPARLDRRLSAFAAVWLGGAAALFAFAAASAVAGPGLGALAAAAAGAVTGTWSFRRVPLDRSAASRGRLRFSAAAAIVSLVQLARQTTFAVDPSRTAASLLPSSAWESEHSCLTAYHVAAEAIGREPDVYAGRLYSSPDDDPSKPRRPLRMGAFRVDVFEYPPPFLLLPRALRLAAPDFLAHRMLWFGLNGALVLAGLIVVARALPPAAATRALLLVPIVFASVPTLSTLQKGNVQVAIVALAMMGMLLIERRRPAAGGALLAFATLSKLYPALLGLYLLVERRGRAIVWTAAFGVAFTLASLADVGVAPFQAFLGHLPGLLSGEAFPAFRNPPARAINFSIPGLVFKAGLFGLPWGTFAAAKLVGWIYTAVACTAIVVAARRPRPAASLPALWLAILVLATLRSPFLPQAYAAVPPLWLATLLFATREPSPRAFTVLVATVLALNVFWPMDSPIDPRVLALVNLVPQTVTVLLAIAGLRSGADASPPYQSAST